MLDFEELVAVCYALVRRRRQKKVRPRTRAFWVHPIIGRRLSCGQFHTVMVDLRSDPGKCLHFLRMSMATFDEVVALVGPTLQRQETNMRYVISPEERIAVTLRYLATGSTFTDLHFMFRIGVSTISQIVNETCAALWEKLAPVYMWEPSEEDWLRIAAEFQGKADFPNCIGSLNSKHVQCLQRKQDGTKFYNYKKRSSMVLMALVDANYRFVAVDIVADRDMEEPRMFRETSLGQKILRNRLQIPRETLGKSPLPFVFVADGTFPLTGNVLRPYPSRNVKLPQGRAVFNCRLLRARRLGEAALAILADKWKVLENALLVGPDFAEKIIRAACVLHNLVRLKDGISSGAAHAISLAASVPGVDFGVSAGRTSADVRHCFVQFWENTTCS